MMAQAMLNSAIQELGNLNAGDEFIVKDLFKGHFWNKQDRAERLLLGTLFLNYVKQNQDKIKVLDKNASNQQKYELLDATKFMPIGEIECFLDTNVMRIEKKNSNSMFVSIGTSGIDLYEMSISSEADIDRLSNILHHSLTIAE